MASTPICLKCYAIHLLWQDKVNQVMAQPHISPMDTSCPVISQQMSAHILAGGSQTACLMDGGIFPWTTHCTNCLAQAMHNFLPSEPAWGQLQRFSEATMAGFGLGAEFGKDSLHQAVLPPGFLWTSTPSQPDCEFPDLFSSLQDPGSFTSEALPLINFHPSTPALSTICHTSPGFSTPDSTHHDGPTQEDHHCPVESCFKAFKKPSQLKSVSSCLLPCLFSMLTRFPQAARTHPH